MGVDTFSKTFFAWSEVKKDCWSTSSHDKAFSKDVSLLLGIGIKMFRILSNGKSFCQTKNQAIPA